jgi:UDP-galactopyranose mutase
MYDYLIVGSGIFGSTFACEANKAGKKCLVIDKRDHIGGNCYTKEMNGINIHVFGPHIFNTNNKQIWDYINQFCEFEQYTHRVKVNYQDKIYSFPINLLTFNQLWGCKTPQEAQQEIEKRKKYDGSNNLKNWIVSQVGEEIFEIFYKGYSEKQWMRDCSEIPASIGKRIPIRFDFNDNYHKSTYCGIPKNGNYTQIFEKMLSGIEVKLNMPLESGWEKIAKKLIYTGPVDELFDYKYGPLDYRSLRFEHKVLSTDNFQGTSQVNYTDKAVPWTRIIEHKWFSPKDTKGTVITYEYPELWEQSKERYYPINNDETKVLYKKYTQEIPENIIVSGRLGKFKYLDMDACINLALKEIKKEFNTK